MQGPEDHLLRPLNVLLMSDRISPISTAGPDEQSWERLWAPYDEATYEAVLDAIDRRDRVLEIGAGDLRLARRLAQRAERVYAIEIRGDLLLQADHPPQNPENLYVWWADARHLEFPPDLTVAVLLMRHCTHFAFYWRKLSTCGCPRLITNARWGFGVEVINLGASRRAYSQAAPGWFACRCGKTGFILASPELLDDELLNRIQELDNCPDCASRPGVSTADASDRAPARL